MSEPNPAENATRKSATPPLPHLAPDTVAPNQTGPWGTPNAASASQSPTKIGKFEVRKLLGEGAFARVYLGFDPELEREVAIKVPKVEALTPEFRDTFLRENRLAAIIQHRNICPVYEVGTDNGLPYIVMPMVPDTLAGVLKRLSSPMPPKTAIAITRKLALGLAAAHAQKVIHRDLKPANVLYDATHREVLIADFGLARLVDRASEASNGVPKGTPAYMAPEQARGQASAIGPHSDVYSLGIMLYEMLTGRVPFSGSIWEVMRDHCEKPPIPPSRIRFDLDTKLDALCLKALAKAPEERYTSAKDFATTLANYLRGLESHESGEFPPVETSPSAKSTNPNANNATSEILDLPGPDSPSRSKGVPRAAPVPQPPPAPAERSSRRRPEPPPPPPPASRSRSRSRSRRDEREPVSKSMSPPVLVGIIGGIMFVLIFVFFVALAMIGYFVGDDVEPNYPNNYQQESDWRDTKEQTKPNWDFEPNNKANFPPPPK